MATLRQTEKNPATSRTVPSAAGSGPAVIDSLRDTVLTEGNVSESDVEALHVCDDPDEVLAILEDVRHRRPRAAA